MFSFSFETGAFSRDGTRPNIFATPTLTLRQERGAPLFLDRAMLAALEEVWRRRAVFIEVGRRARASSVLQTADWGVL
jgi:hypothetical protein